MVESVRQPQKPRQTHHTTSLQANTLVSH